MFRRILNFFLILIALLGIVAVCFMLFFKQIKSSLIAQGVEKINEQLVAKVEVDPNIELSLFEDFPHVTLIFKDVKIYEPHTENNPALLASAQKLTLGFNVINVIVHKKYTLEKVSLFKAAVFPGIKANGEPNYNIFKKPDSTSKTEPLHLDIKHIVLKEVSCSYFNKPSKHLYDFEIAESNASFHIHNNQYTIALEGKVNISGIHIDQVTYFQDRLVDLNGSLLYKHDEGLVTLEETTIALNKSQYSIAGIINTENQKIDLRCVSKSGEIATLLSLLPSKDAKWIKKYQNSGKVYFDATVKGTYGKHNSPALNIAFGFEKTDISNPEGGQTIKNATLKGTFTNGAQHSAQSAVIEIENFSGTLNNNPIKGSFKLSNLSDPLLVISAHLTQNLQDIHQFVPIDGVDSLKGKITLSFDFEGKVQDLKRKEGFDKIKASGEAQVENGELYLVALDKSAKNISADLIFNNTDISINTLSFKSGRSDISLDGLIKNVLRKIILGKGNVFVEGSLYSKRLVYEDFILPVPSGQSDANKKTSTSLLLFLACRVDKLEIADVKARNLNGLLRYNDSLLTLTNGKMEISGGKVSGDASIETILPLRSKHIRLSNAFSDISIDSILHDLHDFEQTFISYKNLSGKLSGTSNVFFILNPDGTVLDASVLANISIDIVDGRLRDFAPMMSLSKFAEEAALKDVRFSKLTNQILIKNKVISIPEMHISSNVCNIDLSGTHTFDNTFSYRLKVPLKNLSKRKQVEATKSGALEGTGLFDKSNIFVLIEGNGNDFEVKFDKSSTRQKIQADIQREKEELQKAFNNEAPEIKNSQINEEEFFDFE